MSEDFYPAIVSNFDDQSAVAVVTQALTQIIEQNPDVKPLLVQLMRGLNSTEGKVAAINFMSNTIIDEEVDDESIAAVISFSGDEDASVRRAATGLLRRTTWHADVRARLQQLFSDKDQEVKNLALSAAPQMAALSTQQPAAAALFVIPDETKRDEALQILEELEHAVNVIIDIGNLGETELRIADELVLPRITELRGLLAGTSDSQQDVQNARKQGLVTASGLATGARALALATATVGSADEAVNNVRNGADALFGVVDMLLQLVR